MLLLSVVLPTSSDSYLFFNSLTQTLCCSCYTGSLRARGLLHRNKKTKNLFLINGSFQSQTANIANNISVLKNTSLIGFPKSLKPWAWDETITTVQNSVQTLGATNDSVRPHEQKHQALKLVYCKPESRCLFRISSLCEARSISVCSVHQWMTRVQMHNMPGSACIKQDNRASKKHRSQTINNLKPDYETRALMDIQMSHWDDQHQAKQKRH